MLLATHTPIPPTGIPCQWPDSISLGFVAKSKPQNKRTQDAVGSIYLHRCSWLANSHAWHRVSGKVAALGEPISCLLEWYLCCCAGYSSDPLNQRVSADLTCHRPGGLAVSGSSAGTPRELMGSVEAAVWTGSGFRTQRQPARRVYRNHLQ